jgi:glc operon protein GlcG
VTANHRLRQSRFEESGVENPASTHGLCRLFCSRVTDLGFTRDRRVKAKSAIADLDGRRLVEEASQMLRMLALACALALCAIPAFEPALAQQTEASGLPPYGPPITLDQAKRVMAAAELQAVENSWQVAITILDSGGNMVMFHKLDNAQLSAVSVSEGKARTALQFKRPSKDLDDAIARGGAGNRLLALKDITPLEGGIPLTSADGKIIGAIGVSGAVSAQDAQVAKAGADVLAR